MITNLSELGNWGVFDESMQKVITTLNIIVSYRNVVALI